MIIVTSNILLSASPLLLISAAIVFVPFVSRISKYITTLIHEIGHGIVAIPFGGRISKIKLHHDGSGETESKYGWFLYHPVRLVSLLMGYGAPIYVGLALLIASYHNQPLVSLWILGVAGLLALIAIRNLFGLVVVLSYNLFIIYLIFTNNNLADISAPVVVVALVLILRGILDVVHAGKTVFDDDADNDETDFHLMEDEMILPPKFWFILFVVFHVIVIATLILVFFPISFS